MTAESCRRCAGRGLVEIRRCPGTPICKPIRHDAEACPVVTLTKCPACAKAELSETSIS
jgi:hypothetical protein